MKFPLGHRLFLAMLLSAIALAVVELELVRWKLFEAAPQLAKKIELDRLGDLTSSLSAQYRQRHDWSFLPADADARKTWLRDELARLQNGPNVQAGVQSPSPILGYRIGLLDKDNHYLAGAIASRAMIVFASIDTIERSIVVDDQAIGYLIDARPQNPADELAVAFLVDQQNNLAIVAAISVLLSALIAALLAANFRKPIKQLVEGARQLEDARFDARLAIRRSDELGELADTFNHLAARLENTEQSRQQWVADTSHELRTPLSVLRGQMEALQDGIRPATPENIAIMLRQIQSLTKLVDELYQLASADVGQWEYNKTACDVWRLVDDTLKSFSEKLRVAGLIATIGTPPAHSTVHCDVERIRQVLTNLLENCVRYTATGGRIEVNGVVVGDELRIAIDDSVPGVPEPSLNRLGERFFRVESSRNRQLGGAGLGLSLSKQILQAHGGRLEFGPSPLGGLRATFVLKLEASQ
jgi:two-component system sensor histidine kinase BaeS